MPRLQGVYRHLRKVETHEEVDVTDLLEPLELAALERLLTRDDALRGRVFRLLVEHAVDVAGLEVEVVGGRVTLGGSVPDHLTSLLVEDLVWLIPHVQQCHNRLRVGRAA